MLKAASSYGVVQIGTAEQQCVDRAPVRPHAGHKPGGVGRAAGGERDRRASREGPALCDAVHLEEIYEEIPAPHAIRVAPSADLHLHELLEELPEWTQVHASTVAVESFARALALLYHEGVEIEPFAAAA